MSIDGAKALAAKVLTDAGLAKQLNEVKTEEEFKSIIAKMGYSCSMEEFEAAFKEAKKAKPLSDEQLDQASGGLSIVGVDYAFVATQTARA
ncbi:MAG: Nif11-like leader peptide family natural product precursor [Eubacteriales bacterium]|nr:Nif11-like leader peptide family natural product precursor [Eubacteriales bacterium]